MYIPCQVFERLPPRCHSTSRRLVNLRFWYACIQWDRWCLCFVTCQPFSLEGSGYLSNEKRAPGCSFRMPVRARSGVPTYHRYLLFFFFFLIQGAFFWVGVGWGGDVNVPCNCTHTWCYAIGCFLHLSTYLMLRHRMFLVGLGWGGVGMLTFLALAHILDATP